jgi:hypothetical protein
MKSRWRAVPVVVLAASPVLRAQTYEDLTFVRNRTQPYASLLQFKAGMIGAVAKEEDPATGLEDGLGLDGHVFYHSESVGGRAGQLDLYGGRDGLLASLRDGKVVGNETTSRLDLGARLWSFYRDGSYQDDAFVPVGLYEGRDFNAYLGFGREVTQGLFLEFGPFYKRNTFSRNERTSPQYSVPDDYDAYGGRLYIEQNTVQLDRRSGLARDGFLLTVGGEREWNGSDSVIGPDSFRVELPSAVWRAKGKLEWYIAQTDSSAWEVFADASLTDEQDRVYNAESWHPHGNLWVDAQLRFRLSLGESVIVTPFAQGQYVKIQDVDLSGSEKKTFFGGGVEAWLHMSDTISLQAWYSYLDNESRPSITIDEDTHGQHMFFAGMVVRFGGARR